MTYPPCPQCDSEFVYPEQDNLICPICSFEWNPNDSNHEESLLEVKDANGTLLTKGDKITLAKDVKVKGSSQGIKIGTKAIIKRIRDGKDHQLDCKVDGHGEMYITAKFVKKAQ